MRLRLGKGTGDTKITYYHCKQNMVEEMSSKVYHSWSSSLTEKNEVVEVQENFEKSPSAQAAAVLSPSSVHVSLKNDDDVCSA
jgi:hypothetical protein